MVRIPKESLIMRDIQPEIFELSNGIRVVYLQAQAHVAHLGVTFLAGSRFEKKGQEGLAHFLEHCIFKGTKKRKTFHILSRLDAVGGELNAYTAKEEMCVYASFTNDHLERATEILSDITLNSTFPAKEIKKEKEIILDEINSYLDSPSDKLFDDFEEHLFTNHPLGKNILGSKKSVQSFAHKDLIAYVNTFFVAEKMVISFVGENSLNQVKRLLEKYFRHFRSGEDEHSFEEFTGYKPFSIRTKEGNYQVHSLIGALAPSYKNDQHRAMSLLINSLGGPALNSRLTLSIREKYGYAYNVEANYTPYADTGFWNVYIGSDQKYSNKTIELVQKELRKMCDQKFGVLQLKRAKEQLKGHLALGMDSNSGLMLGLGKSLLLMNQIDTIEDIHEGIDKLTAEELLDVANEYLHPDSISILTFDLLEK